MVSRRKCVPGNFKLPVAQASGHTAATRGPREQPERVAKATAKMAFKATINQEKQNEKRTSPAKRRKCPKSKRNARRQGHLKRK
jgi:hypothetical protein